MPLILRRILAALSFALLLAYAYAPLMRAQFVGEDFPVLADAGTLVWQHMRAVDESGVRHQLEVADFYGVHGTDERPLAALSLALSTRLWSDRGFWNGTEAVYLRAENLVLLGLGAWALRRLVRRLLLPWTGSDQAQAAGTAAAALFLLHPLCLSSVATVASRGDVLAMTIGLLSASAFMRGRQERQYGFTVAAGAGAVAIGMCSELSMFLPPILAIGEFVSARRYRSAHVRLRTAATTLVVFGGAITLEALFRFALSDSLQTPSYARSLSAILDNSPQALTFSLEKLGVLLLPVNTFGIGELGYAIAGMITLVALQPALVAARSAPRLWFWLVVAWGVSIVFSELPQALVRVHPRDLTHARVLFPAAAVMSVGLGVAATALSGARRQLLPLAAALGLSVLAHANALPWTRASVEVERLRSDLAEARVLHGKENKILVVDPPVSVSGLDAVRPALSWMLDPAFSRDGAKIEGLARGLTFDALRLYTREPEFQELRRNGLILLFPKRLLDTEVEGDARESILLGQVVPSDAARMWRATGRSPTLEIDALDIRAVRARALPDRIADTAPVLAWRSRCPLAEQAQSIGVWTKDEDGWVALFDVERSFAWLVALRIRKAWFEGELTSLVTAEVMKEMPPVPGDPTPKLTGDDDWVFDLDASALPIPNVGEPVWTLELLALTELSHYELEGELTVDDRVIVRGAGAVARAAGVSGPVAWSLDYVAEGVSLARVSVARVRGRRVQRDGTPLEPLEGKSEGEAGAKVDDVDD